MNAVPRQRPAPARLALLGTGTVGAAFRRQVGRWDDALALVAVANTRECIAGRGWRGPVDAAGEDHGARAVRALGSDGVRIVVDATASDDVARRHAGWLGSGIHVVTACKLGQGTSLERWRAIAAAAARTGTCYGDSATVGAGLPLLRSLRDLRAGGERITAIAGVLSGSLAWLMSRHDGSRPFRAWVEEAAARGYTEPDPHDDLSGEDVRRKLLILARSAGIDLEYGAVDVAPIDPGAMDARLREARASGRRLAYVARLQCATGGVVARAGLECLEAGDPLENGGGTDNRVAIWCDRYRERPLVIQGPGAGADITAAALLDDVLGIARRSRSRASATAYSGTGSRTSPAR